MKKTYEKPEIKKVELKPEEAVLTKCKNAPHSCSPVNPAKTTFS
jgi:hypothetical protein